MENLEYSIVLDVVNAEAQVNKLNQELVQTGKEVDTVNSKGLDGLAGTAKKATQDVDNLNKTVAQAKSVNLEWGDAFTDTMLNVADSVSVASPGFRELVNQTKGAIPIVKSLNLTAVKGLKGVKAAIASTGIGLLIIAVGELAANWDKVTSAVKSFIGEAKIDKLTEGLSKFWDKAKEVFAGIFKNLTAFKYTITKGFSNLFAAIIENLEFNSKPCFFI